jgi:hypothetical protein
VASLRWGYLPAATLGAWTVTKDEQGLLLMARVTTADPYRLSQQPIVFVAPHSKGMWRWPVNELQITGAECSARLGPMET